MKKQLSILRQLPILLILVSTVITSCSDDKKQKLLVDHLQKSEFQNFKLKPELGLYLQLMQAKTNTSMNSAGYNAEFLNNSDSILNYFSIEITQDSVDVIHKNLTTSAILEKIAIDIKPMVENYKMFQGISIVWTTRIQLTKDIDAGSSITYKQLLDNIPNKNKFYYEYFNDTLVFEDYYYNDTLALMGKYLGFKSTGKWYYWYPNGIKKMEGSFINDLRDGNWSFYYPNGKMKMKGQYTNGEKVGDWKKWDESGVEKK